MSFVNFSKDIIKAGLDPAGLWTRVQSSFDNITSISETVCDHKLISGQVVETIFV